MSLKIARFASAALLCLAQVGCASRGRVDTPRRPSGALLPLTGTTTLRDARLDKVRAGVEGRLDRGELVSLTVGVAQHGRVLWSEGFGWADREKKIRATPDAGYRLASLSKSIAATVVFTLIEQGLITLDDSVNDRVGSDALRSYVGEDSNAVTIRDLLASTGGIPHGWYTAASQETALNIRELASWIGVVAFPPGSTWEYSNFSLGLTQLVVEAVSGESYEHYARHALFAPLGMESTATTSSELTIASHLVAAYGRDGGRIDTPGIDLPEAGLGMVSSANDLLRFGMFANGDLDRAGVVPVGAANRSVMMHERTIAPIFRLGWYEVNGDILSNGSATGASSTLMIVPESDLIVVVLSNTTGREDATDAIAAEIKSVLAPSAPQAQGYDYAAYAAEYETPYAPTPDLSGHWSGRLEWPHGGVASIGVTFGEAGVEVDVEGNPPVPADHLIFNRHGRFKARARLMKFPKFFSSDQDAASVQLSLQLSRGELVGYVRVARASDERSYALPVSARLTRNPGDDE